MAFSSGGYAQIHPCFQGTGCTQYLDEGWLEARCSDSSWESVLLNPFQGETAQSALGPSIKLGPGGGRRELLLSLLRTASLHALSVQLLNGSPVGYQIQVISGTHPMDVSPKGWGTDVCKAYSRETLVTWRGLG